MAMECAFVEFLAEEELVYIVPSFREEKIDFVSGSIGPFIPNSPIKVPLWLAIALRKQAQCRIQCPDWLQANNLKALKRLEKTSGLSVLQKVPDHYIEIASQILRHASDDIENVQQVRSLLEDIENLRQHKIREGLHRMAEEEASEALHFLKLNNASVMEINSIRTILLTTLEKFHKLYEDGTQAVMDSMDIHRDPTMDQGTYNASARRTIAPQFSQETTGEYDTQDVFTNESQDEVFSTKRLRSNRE